MAGRIILGMPLVRRSGVRCIISMLGLDFPLFLLLFFQSKGNIGYERVVVSFYFFHLLCV